MKRPLVILAVFFTGNVYARQPEIYQHQLRITVDEDFLNIRGRGTDRAYTGGVHVGYYDTRSRPLFFLDRWLPKAGRDAVNTYGTGISQLTYTPRDLSTPEPQPDDYAYSGALVIRRQLYSGNAQKRYAIYSGFLAGVMGPVSLAGKLQVFIHRVIDDETPLGWDNQLPDDLLINIEAGVEKSLLEKKWATVIGGIHASAGSMLNTAGAYLLLRAGKTVPYFSGWLSQSGMPSFSDRKKKRWQFFVSIRPSVRYTAYNALLEGGIILHKKRTVSPSLNRVTGSFDYGITLVFRNICISFTQMVASSLVKHQNSHEVGSVLLTFSW